MTKGARLIEIVKCCEARFDRGEAATWKHGDFVDLHREIQLDTDTNISPSTLKRIFGKVAVDEDYIPQQATLDALKKYGKYVEPDNQQTVRQPPSLPSNSPKPGKTVKRFEPVLLILAVMAVLVGFLAWQFLKPKDIPAKITIARTEGQLPATAIFDLQLPQTEDSLFVNFGDKSPWTYIKPDEKTAAHIYYFPGVFTVSAQSRQQVISTTSAYIPSGGWIAFGCHRQDDIPVHFYAFPPVKSGSDSLFEITSSQLSILGLDTTGPILTRLSNYTAFGNNADDFIFETTFKNTLPEKGIYCRSTQFQISGSNSMIRFKFSSPGCTPRILNVLSEQTFKGSTDNLSQFVLDLKQWNTVKLINHKKQVSLYVNGKQIFNGNYQRSLGEMRGLFLEFEGTGIVKTCELKTPGGKLLYRF